MKIGVTYNLFDGEELLEDSIRSIRDDVDYINVIYQDVSNFGVKNSTQVKDILKQLYDNKMIDDVFLYNPNLKVYANINEIKKRNIGLNKCRENNCDFVMLMDTDEFYNNKQLKNIIEYSIKNNLDAVYSKMYTYYKTKNYILDPIETYYVPVLYKIHPNTKLDIHTKSPYVVDGTRKSTTIDKYKLFDENELVMHHMSYVRKDIRKKLMNSSARINFNDYISEMVDHYNNWDISKGALVDHLGGKPKHYNLKYTNEWGE